MALIVLSLVCTLGFAAGTTLAPYTSTQRLDSWLRISQLLQKSDYSGAERELGNWPSGTVKYSVSGVSNARTEAAERLASDLIKRTTGGKLVFERGEPATVKLTFDDDNIIASPEFKDNVWSAKVPLRQGADEIVLGESGIARRIARAFCEAVGLGTTDLTGAIMGSPAPYDASGPIGFTPAESDCLNRILAVREELSTQIASHTNTPIGIPKLELKTGNTNLGIFQENERPYFEFEISNSGTAPLEMIPEMSCRCISLTKLTPLGAGEKRIIRMTINTEGLHGSLEKSMKIFSNDPTQPLQEIRLRLTVVPPFRVVPDSFDRVALNDVGSTTFDLYFYATPGNSMHLASAIPSMPHIKTSIEPYNGEILDPAFDTKPVKRVGYKVQVTFDSDFPSGVKQLSVILRTDRVEDRPKTVIFLVQKGIVAYPTTAYFGNVPTNAISKRIVKITHPTKAFKVTSAVVESGPFKASIEPDGADGKSYSLVLQFVGDQKGQLTGSVKVTTDMPGYETIIVKIIGNAV